jgi:hypothetical protein
MRDFSHPYGDIYTDFQHLRQGTRGLVLLVLEAEANLQFNPSITC